MSHLLPLLAVLLPTLAAAAAPGEPVRARRATGPIVADGRLEEPAWNDAVPYDGFVQEAPDEGKPPSERTEVRVLYDDQNLYVGIRCLDSRPEAIVRPLGRRDDVPYSDTVGVFVDSNRDRTTAAYFGLNAAGVQEDGLLFSDDRFSSDWDAVWDGAAAATADGWTAEFVIPLSVLRFSAAHEQVWGFGVRRILARTHEEIVSIPLKKADRAVVSKLADLTGLDGIQPVRELSVTPYLASRLSWRPKYSDEATPRPRLVDPMGDVGVDLRSSLGRGLALTATVNPDFGQVEADQIVQNLSTFELFFPEKRPFFTQGMDLFQGAAPQDHRSPQQLFYSRRIGLDAPILAAAKLSGRTSDTWQLGALEAVVAGAGAPGGSTEAAPVRGYRFRPEQPLHFGPAGSLPTLAPASRNFLAAFGRWQPDPATGFGASVASALPIGPRCTADENALDDDHRPARCDVDTGNAVALDANLRTADGDWYLRGQVTGSQHLGGEPERLLADGTRLARGDLGGGGFVTLGRQGGEPWRVDLSYEYASPRLDLNAVGFQRTQNQQLLHAVARYVRPSGGGPFRSYGLHLGGDASWTTDGRGWNRGASGFFATEWQLQSFDYVGANVFASSDADDVREIEQTGVVLRTPGTMGWETWASTDRGRPVWVEGGVSGGRTVARGPLPATGYWGLGGKIVVRPHPRAETRLDVSYDDSHWPARYLDASTGGGGQWQVTLAELHAPSLSLTLRQAVVVSPRLTLQAYAQLFTATGHYGRYYAASGASGGRIGFSALGPGSPAPGNDFRTVELNLSAVVRWEYRLGSTLFLVYTRSAAELPAPDGQDPPLRLRPRGLDRGPAHDTVLVKWSWYWSA